MNLDRTIHTMQVDASIDKDIERITCSVAEGAHFLGIGTTKMWELVHSGELTTFKIGRRTLIPKKSISEFIELRISLSAKNID